MAAPRRPARGGIIGQPFPTIIRWRIIAVIGGLLAVALLLGVVGYVVTGSHERSLSAHGVDTAATVTAASPAHPGATIDVTFAGTDGRSHVARISVTSPIAVGTPVRVRYDRTDTTNAQLTGPDAGYGTGDQRGLFLAVDIALALGLVIVGAFALRLRRQGVARAATAT